MKTNKKEKVIVIGIDGGAWELLNLMMKNGHMSALKNIVDNGRSAILNSSVPPTTGPAWVTFATGKNPGKHGCFDFLYPDGRLDSLKTISTKRIHGATVYEYLKTNHKKSILINLPCSYPPRTDDITITSLLTRGDQFVFPNKIADEIPEFQDYRLTPKADLLLKKQYHDYVNDIRKIEATRFECAQKLFGKDWDFFFVLFSGADWIQHEFYDKLISDSLPDDHPAVGYYRDLDKYIDWFIREIDAQTNVIIMSDHGFGLYKGIFYINEWLRKEGYLEIKNDVNTSEKQHRVNEEMDSAMKRVIKKIKIPYAIRNFIQKNRFINNTAVRIYELLRDKFSLKFYVDVTVDLSKTKAFSTTSELNGIYLNKISKYASGIVEDKDCDALRGELIEKLKQLTDEDGEPIFKYVHKKESIYKGDMLKEAPDIVMELGKWVVGANFPTKIIEKRQTIYHHSEGICLMHGPAIETGKHSGALNIYDMSPVILHLLNMPVPDDMDGQIATELFTEDYVLKNPVSYATSQNQSGERRENKSSVSEDDEIVIARLKSLGYMT